MKYSSICQKNPKLARYLKNCDDKYENKNVKNLLFLLIYLTIFSFIIGIIYMIVKVVPFQDIFNGTLSFSEFIYQITHIEVCDVDPIDIWSLNHFIIHITIVVLLYYLFKNELIAFFISIGFSFIWELFERWLVIYVYNFACESILNSISDMLFGLGGSVLGYFLLSFPQNFENNNQKNVKNIKKDEYYNY